MMRRALGLGGLLVMGAAIAAIGTLSHRTYPFYGVIAVVVMTFTGALFARAWHDWAGLALYSGAWAIVVFLLAQAGPGGSVLIVEDALGYTYLLGSAAAIVLVSFTPSFLIKGREHVA
ncbi:hypothetical protein [Demequina sp. NBRC 110054]|uniref:hypothetical protein n=1 Tax=Demequina sp. NBRC 110054 TaxID=1570343 RepID=UPI001177C414|nr:hypothetical protein [Demequina sp. NBRC 110054]